MWREKVGVTIAAAECAVSGILSWQSITGLVPGRFLTGNQVSDDPALVTLKLKGWLAPALKDHVEPLRTAYEAARTASCAHDQGPDDPAQHVELDAQTIQT